MLRMDCDYFLINIPNKRLKEKITMISIKKNIFNGLNLLYNEKQKFKFLCSIRYALLQYQCYGS